MCIIVHKPKGVSLDDSVYKICFENNPDGAGFMYHDSEANKLVTKKGFMKVDPLLEELKALGDIEIVVHFRIASPGMVINEENCHPFTIDSDSFENYKFAVVHNGRLPCDPTKEKSDTAVFVEGLLGPILSRDPWFLNSMECKFLLAQHIGVRNKVVVMSHDSDQNKSDVQIVNRAQGTDALGCWFSNTSYLQKKKDVYTGPSAFFSGRPRYIWDAITSKFKQSVSDVKEANGEADKKEAEKGGTEGKKVDDSSAGSSNQKLIAFEPESDSHKYWLSKPELKRLANLAWKACCHIYESTGLEQSIMPDPREMDQNERIDMLINDQRAADPIKRQWTDEHLKYWCAHNSEEAMENVYWANGIDSAKT